MAVAERTLHTRKTDIKDAFFIRLSRNTISNIPGSMAKISEEMSSENENEIEMLDDDEDVLAYLKSITRDEPAMTCNNTDDNNNNNKSNHHESKESLIAHKVTKRVKDKQNCIGNRTNMERKSDAGSDTAQSRSPNGLSSMSKGSKTEEDALRIVTDTLQSVNGWYKSADKSDDVEWNFCMTTHSQMKLLKKPKRKLARSQITNIMMNLESSDSDQATRTFHMKAHFSKVYYGSF